MEPEISRLTTVRCSAGWCPRTTEVDLQDPTHDFRLAEGWAMTTDLPSFDGLTPERAQVDVSWWCPDHRSPGEP